MKKTAKVILSIVLLFTTFYPSKHVVKASNGVQIKIEQLRNKFPNGKYWNHDYGNNPDGYTNTPCTHHLYNGGVNCSFDGSCYCNSFESSIQCVGYAKKVFYDIFGISAMSNAARIDVANIKAGDYVLLDNGNHAALVIDASAYTITLAEANYGNNCYIKWDRVVNKNTIVSFRRAYNYDQVASSGVNKPDASWVVPVTELKDGGVLVSWPVVQGATSYDVEITRADQSSLERKHVTTTSCFFSLSAKGTYYARILAANSGGYSLSSYQIFWIRSSAVHYASNQLVRIKSSKPNKYIYYDSEAKVLKLKAYSSLSSEIKKYLFRLIPAENGSYFIQSEWNGLVIDVTSNSNNNGAPIVLYGKNGTSAQKFIITTSDFGGSVIHKADYGVVFDSGNENKLCTWAFADWNNSNQRYEIQKTVLYADSISFKSANRKLSLNESVSADVTVGPSYAINKIVKWRVNDPHIVEIQNGVMKAKKVGSTYVYASLSSGKIARQRIDVVPLPEKVTLSTSAIALNIQGSYTPNSKVFPANANQRLIWSSKNAAIASVNSNGKITALSYGKTYIYAKTPNGKVEKLLVTVRPNATAVKLNTYSASMAKGKTKQLKATLYPTGTSQAVTWKSNNTKVVTVDKNGKVTAKGKGTAYIIATSVNKKTVSCKFVVK